MAAQHAVSVNSFTTIALTKLDVLDKLSRIRICVRYETDGKVIEDFLTELYLLEKARPIYELTFRHDFGQSHGLIF